MIFSKKIVKAVSAVALIFSISSCMTVPVDVLKLPPDHLAKRQQQSRQYDTVDEEKILSACAGVLQDLGFAIEKSETKLGVIFASKDRKVDNGGQLVTATFLTALAAAGGSGGYNYYSDVEKNQKIRASVISQKSADGSKMIVRVAFQTMVWNMAGRLSRIQTLSDEDLYQGFYEKLSKAIFLEEQLI